MNANPKEAVQDRHLELLLAELGGREAPVDCHERVANALAGAARTRPRMRLLRPLVAVAAAGIVVAVAWCARGQTPAALPTPPTPTIIT